MSDYNDIVGKQFGRLVVLEYSGYFVKDGTKNKRHYYKCKCTCDKETILFVDRYKLLSEHTTSCGCKAIEHIKQVNKTDNPSKYYKRKINKNYIDDFGVCHIKMSNSNNDMLCDVDCMDELLKYYWYERDGYATTNFNYKKLLAHRIIMDVGDYDGDNQIDHINGNRLDNRKNNLRIVTSQQNSMNAAVRSDNTSGATGVFWYKTRSKWRVQIVINGKAIHLGYFNNFEDAVKARKDAEEKYFGEYSYVMSREKRLVS